MVCELTTHPCLSSLRTDFLEYYQIAYMDPKMLIWDQKAAYADFYKIYLDIF